MALLSWILKYVSQRVFRENDWNKFGVEDPYYDTYEVEQQSFFSGTKVKKVKKPKALPVGISDNDTTVLKKVMRRAYHLDMLFKVPVLGYRIGWNGIVGIVPVVGDLLTIIFSLMLFKLALKVDGGLPYDVQAMMIINIIIDFGIGLIPIVGDLVEVMYKANSRNALLLEKHLQQKAISLNPSHKLQNLDDSSGITDESLDDTTFDENNTPLKAPSKPHASGVEKRSKHEETPNISVNGPSVDTFRSRTFSK